MGQRYIQLTQGVGDLSRLPKDGTIPMERTEPALDLTVLFNGFKPLFKALSPTDINKLSAHVISVFQGEGDNFNGLLQSTASLTNTLADRDQVIGDLIDNLNIVLETLSSRDKQLSELIIEFKDFMSGLVEDKDAILGTLDSISTLADETSDLTVGIRPAFVRDVKGLRQVATNLNRGRSEIDRALQIMPIKLTKIGRTAINGSFFNFYLCQFQGNVDSSAGSRSSRSSTTAAPSARTRGVISDEHALPRAQPRPDRRDQHRRADRPAGGGLQCRQPAAHRGRRHLQRRLRRVRRPQARRRGADRRRPRRQGRRRGARG